MVRRALTVPVAALALAAGTWAPAVSSAGAAGSAGATLVVGSQTLERCGLAPLTYCGRLSVPLDRADPGSPDISVAYRWYPATDPGAPPEGTVLPVEGGPGYPSVGSVRTGYDPMYGPLLARWNLLAVDLRGTGNSTPVDCPGIQDFVGQPSGPDFAAAAGACGASLDHRWTDAAGRYVHASDLFTSAVAAADVADVIRALDVPRVDLYGDSYGSWFAQVFADRYPALVRSVVLDSTYSTVDIDPWYRSSHTAMPGDFDAACSRSPACAADETEPAWNRIAQLAALLRHHPLAGTVPDASGHVAEVQMDVVGLVDLVNDAAGDPDIYRSLDAAARAELEDGDPAPLLRLYAQRLAFDENYLGAAPTSYSGGLYLAVSCVDYPQLFSLSDAPARRRAELAAAVAALPAGTFAPFTTDEWLRQDQNTEAYTACTSWPSPVDPVPPTTGTLPLLPADLPVLVLGGEFDTWTPPSDVPGILGQVGGDHRFVELANATHVVGEGDQACGSALVQAFVADPSALATLDTSCAAAVPPLRSIGSYPADLAGVTPLTAGAGNGAGSVALATAAAAVATAGDAVDRVAAIGAVPDVGLAGGTVTPARGGHLLRLAGDQLVPGVAVSGTVSVGATRVTADLTAAAAGGAPVTLVATWSPVGPDGPARVTGTSGGSAVVGTCPAP